MNRYAFLIPALCALAVGCQDNGKNNQNGNNYSSSQNQSQQNTDSNITAQVREAIKYDDCLSIGTKNSVQVSTDSGVVTLSGTVMNSDEMKAITQNAQNVKGVRRVINQLKVMHAPKNNQ